MTDKKWVRMGIASAVVAIVGGVVFIDQQQSVPLGATLGTADLTFSLGKDMPFDISVPQVIALKDSLLLSSGIVDLRKEHDTQRLPGMSLDVLLGSRTELLRSQRRSSANASATSLLLNGFPDLAAAALVSDWQRGERRQVIAELGKDGRIHVLASMVASPQQFSNHLEVSTFQTPSGQTVILDAEVYPEVRGEDEPSMHHGFKSGNQGKTWQFDARLRVPSDHQDGAFVSETDAYQLDDSQVDDSPLGAPHLLLTWNQAKHWSRSDVLDVVWRDAPPLEGARYRWRTTPFGSGKVIGWSTRWADEKEHRPAQDGEPARPARPGVPAETRRFELDLGGGAVTVRDVIGVSADQSVQQVSSHELVRSPDGVTTMVDARALRHLDQASKRWSAPRQPPPANGSASTVDQFWVGNGVWIVESRNSTLLNKISCYIPPFSRNRFCDAWSVTNRYVSRDRGVTWTPFVVPLISGNFVRGRATVIGWDSQRQKLLVYRESDRIVPYAVIEAYTLPR